MFPEFFEIATRQIGAADAALEQYVAREQAVVLPAVIDQAAGRMARDMNGLKLAVPEPDYIAFRYLPSSSGSSFS